MGNEKIITFVNVNNVLDVKEVELLCAFELNGCKYIVYDKNEKDFDNNSIVYIGKIHVVDDKQYIRNISFEEQLNVKKIINKLINNGDIYVG